MRIGLISGEYPPHQGGVGDFTHRLAEALVALGHDVHVITGKAPATEDPREDSAISTHREIGGWGWGCWRQMLRIARQESLEVLDLQFQTAAYGMHPAIHFVPRREGRPPLVVTFHDLRAPYLFPKAGPVRAWSVEMLARRADGVIVTNVEDEMELSTRQPPLSHLARIPIGSNIIPQLPAGYDRDTWRAKWGLAPADLLLGYFGFLNQRKGGEDLIEVLAALVARGYAAHLLLIGGRVGSSDPTNAAYAERVDHLVAERNLTTRVHRTGFVSAEEVSACLAAVDVCLHPYREGASLRHGSLHACLAHGRAVVTTQPATSAPEFRSDENLLLVPAGDIDALVDSVVRVADDADLRARLERGAAGLATQFTWERIAARTVDFFAELIA